jgi:hypothetical protein
MTPEGRKKMRSYSVTVTMTPRQALEAMDGLHDYAVTHESSRAFTASSRIMCGLFDAGWNWDDRIKCWVAPDGTERDDL